MPNGQAEFSSGESFPPGIALPEALAEVSQYDIGELAIRGVGAKVSQARHESVRLNPAERQAVIEAAAVLAAAEATRLSGRPVSSSYYLDHY